MINPMIELISTPGCLLSVGRVVSLLGVFTPEGSHPSRYSHRSQAPSVPINFIKVMYYKILLKTTFYNPSALLFKFGLTLLLKYNKLLNESKKYFNYVYYVMEYISLKLFRRESNHQSSHQKKEIKIKTPQYLY